MAAGSRDVSEGEKEQEQETRTTPRPVPDKQGPVDGDADPDQSEPDERKPEEQASGAGSGSGNGNANDEDAEMQDAEEEEGDEEDGKEDDNAKDDEDASDGGAKDASDGDDKSAPKKSRRELPPHTVAILKGWMLSTEHFKHPYPTDEDKQMLLKKTGITMKQLTNWFTNARKRIWKPMMKREHSRQLQNAMGSDGARGRAMPTFPAAPGQPQYADGMFPPRQAVRRSFEAPAAIGMVRDPRAMYAVPQGFDPAMNGYPMNRVAMAYGARPMRSMSEATGATISAIDDGVDAMHIRKRGLDVIAEAAGSEQADKRLRPTGLSSPNALKALHDWVATHDYPMPTDTDKLQLSRDTGLGVQQIELWFQERAAGGSFAAALPQQQQQSGRPMYPTPATNGMPTFPQRPVYGQRQSTPFPGNPMFPPRPAPGGMRPSIPGPGNLQFPPGPNVPRDPNGGFRQAPGNQAAAYPAFMRRPGDAPSPYAGSASPAGMPPAIPIAVGGPGPNVLPSLPNRAFIAARSGPMMGQPRDGRSHTLDMGQFADARRRTMNFQDILASANNAQHQAPPPAPTNNEASTAQERR